MQILIRITLMAWRYRTRLVTTSSPSIRVTWSESASHMPSRSNTGRSWAR